MEIQKRNRHLQYSSGESQPPRDHDQAPSASSSSSLRSSSHGSPYYSALQFNTPPTSHVLEHGFRPAPSAAAASPYQQAAAALSQTRNAGIPTIEYEDAAMIHAYLAVISSPSSSMIKSQQIVPPASVAPVFQADKQSRTAFRVYRPPLGVRIRIPGRDRKQGMMKRSIALLRTIRERERMRVTSPSSTYMQPAMSERRRRQKLNESFHALRSLLPNGTKRDKASVLSVATAHLTSLKAQVPELGRRNQALEEQFLPQKAALEAAIADSSSNQWIYVGIRHFGESSSSREVRNIDLHVERRGKDGILDMVIRLLEFLKNDQKISLVSIEGCCKVVDSSPVNCIIFRLKIEGIEWEESAFQEAVRRVVNQ